MNYAESGIMLQINQLINKSKSNKGQNTHDSPTFEQPLSLLRSCHDKIIHFSSSLYKLSQALHKDGWTEQLETSADQIRHYFNVAGPEHHKDEEEHLFPAVIALDPECTQTQSLELVSLINTLIREHVESDLLWEALDNMLAERTEDFNSLEQMAEQFAQSMSEHAQIENEQIFPYAEQHISEQAFREMGRAIAKRRGVKL